MSGARRLTTTAAFLVLSGISVYGGFEAVRLASRHKEFAPTEEHQLSVADKLLRDEVLAEELGDKSPEAQRDLALRLEQRLEEGGWKLSPGRLKKNQQQQLGKNLFFLARAWMQAKRERFEQLPAAERSAFIAQEAGKLNGLVERGRALSPSDHEKYLEGIAVILENPTPDSSAKQRGMWPVVLRETAAEGMNWWGELDAPQQRKWETFALAVVWHMPREYADRIGEWRKMLAKPEKGRGGHAY